MKPTQLWLIRHGQTVANTQHVLQGISHGELTELGKQQAQKLGERLKNEQFDAVYGSDLYRIKQTLEPILKHQNSVPEYLELIREWNVGIFDLRPKEEYRAALAESGGTQASFRPPEGENYYDVARRVKQFLDMVFAKHQGQKVLICTHGDFIKVTITVLLQQSVEEAINITQDNTALNVFEVSDNDVKQVLLNSTTHLDA